MWCGFLTLIDNNRLFLKVAVKFTLLPVTYEKFSCLASLPILVIIILLHFRYSGAYVVISKYGFNLHLPDY